MNTQTSQEADNLPYGSSNFIPAVVAEIAAKNRSYINVAADGGLCSPLNGTEWLTWQDGDYRKGTVPTGSSPIRFRTGGPTYIYEDPIQNIIVGRQLMRQMLGGDSGKAGKDHYTHENSEDALTWNVFRCLQEAGQLKLAASLFAGEAVTEEPILFIGGQKIGFPVSRLDLWPELQKARDKIEPRSRPNHQQTEPDIALHIPGKLLIFIEAKFDAPVKMLSATSHDTDWWLARYSNGVDLFENDAIKKMSPNAIPEQFLRNIRFAYELRKPTEKVLVVGLMPRRHKDYAQSAAWVTQCLKQPCPVSFRIATWEAIYQALPSDDASLKLIRAYMRSKSLNLRPAFDMH